MPTGTDTPTSEITTLSEIGITKSELAIFVADYANLVVTKETFDDAKKARLAIREKRFAIQKIQESNNDQINNLKKQNKSNAEELIAVLTPIEDAIDKGIKAIEEQKEKDKAEKMRLAEEKHNKRIASLIATGCVFDGINYKLNALEILATDLKGYDDVKFEDILSVFKSEAQSIAIKKERHNKFKEAGMQKEGLGFVFPCSLFPEDASIYDLDVISALSDEEFEKVLVSVSDKIKIAETNKLLQAQRFAEISKFNCEGIDTTNLFTLSMQDYSALYNGCKVAQETEKAIRDARAKELQPYIMFIRDYNALMAWAVKEEMIESNPLGSFVLPKDKPKKPTYYTPEQIKKWENYKSESSIKQKAAHLFVLVMHTGFDYGDLDEVRREHVTIRQGKKYIVKGRHKNGNQAIIPLSEKAEELLELYDYKMRILSNPKFNEYIKVVAVELEINIYINVKAGRKIFMMDALNNKGYDIAPVSRMGGHDSIKTTEQIYSQVNFELVHKHMRQHNR